MRCVNRPPQWREDDKRAHDGLRSHSPRSSAVAGRSRKRYCSRCPLAPHRGPVKVADDNTDGHNRRKDYLREPELECFLPGARGGKYGVSDLAFARRHARNLRRRHITRSAHRRRDLRFARPLSDRFSPTHPDRSCTPSLSVPASFGRTFWHHGSCRAFGKAHHGLLMLPNPATRDVAP